VHVLRANKIDDELFVALCADGPKNGIKDGAVVY
jgi:hypothetical protein